MIYIALWIVVFVCVILPIDRALVSGRVPPLCSLAWCGLAIVSIGRADQATLDGIGAELQAARVVIEMMCAQPWGEAAVVIGLAAFAAWLISGTIARG